VWRVESILGSNGGVDGSFQVEHLALERLLLTPPVIAMRQWKREHAILGEAFR